MRTPGRRRAYSIAESSHWRPVPPRFLRVTRIGSIESACWMRRGKFEGAGACVVLGEEREDVRAVGEQLAQVGDEFAGEVDLG